MRELAERAAAAGHSVELPRLPGHGTAVDDLVPRRWDDWTGEVVAAYERLADRAERIVVAGQSMGGALALWSGLRWPTLTGLVCINPVTQSQPSDVIEMLEEFLDEGRAVIPGGPSDIADPEMTDVAYPDTPVAPLLSFLTEGVAPMADRYVELTMPLRLFTSRQDHVVPPADSDHLAATYGGPVQRTWLERSYHVATRDFERHVVVDESMEFVARVLAHGVIA